MLFPVGVKEYSLSEGYHHYFEVVPAVNEELKRENYRLRHEVYCRDLGWEAQHRDGIERDEYDRHSIHCLVRAIATGMYVGCARIVLARPDDPASPLPFETACAAVLDRSLYDPAKVDRSKIAEISRLAILGHYRRRRREAQKPFSIAATFGEGEDLRLPYLPLGLYLALIAIARRQGIATLYVLIEPRLAATIMRLGVNLRRIGGAVHHRGTRIPAEMDVEHIVAGMEPFVRRLYERIADEVGRGLAAAALPAGGGRQYPFLYRDGGPEKQKG